jgi:hypothetical protein
MLILSPSWRGNFILFDKLLSHFAYTYLPADFSADNSILSVPGSHNFADNSTISVPVPLF